MKKIIIIAISILVIITALVGIGFAVKQFIVLNPKNEISGEYTPEAEITEEQLRKTIVNLYFSDSETGELKEESRLIDAKTLLTEPYKILIEMLIAGPQNEKLKSIIPKETKLNKIELKGDILEIDFGADFTKNITTEQLEKINAGILKTMTTLSEINGVKIL